MKFVNKVLKAYYTFYNYNRKFLNLTVDTIAKIYDISKSTIYEWRNNDLNIVNNKRVFNKKQSIFEYDKLIVDYIIKNKIINYKKIYDAVKNKYNKKISRRTIYNVLKRNNFTHKTVQTTKYPYSKKKFNKMEINLPNKNK